MVLTSLLFTCGFPPFLVYSLLSGRHNKGLKERLGILPKLPGKKKFFGSPRIWLHAASLGEVRAVAHVVDSLKSRLGKCEIIISSTTAHGRKLAEEIFSEETAVLFAPLDMIIPVRMALSTLRPDVMVFFETEIWPTWIVEAGKKGIKTALINGRISHRSLPHYLRFRHFFGEVLKHMDVLSMIMPEDADRIISMGANPEKIEINGNAKYDLLSSEADFEVKEEMRKLFNLVSSQDVFIAGSTRDGEEKLLLDAYEQIIKRFPGIIFIITPRHIERTRVIESMLKARGLSYHLRTEIGSGGTERTAPIVIMDTFGELFKLYSIGTINFCGGSLVPLGGQNPLEPAVWGKMVFYGPFMDDFLDAKTLLEGVKAGVEVSSSGTLAEAALWYLEHRDVLRERGEKARQAVDANHGAAKRHADVIARLIEK